MMERLTRPNLNVDDTAAKFMGEEVKLQDMPDRLLDLVLNGPTLNAVNKDVLRQFIRQLYGALKVYEDMEEQGRLVVLPCQWGTKLYSVFAARHNLLDDGEPPIREIQLVEGNVCPIVRQFGKTVFLNREEAEQALKGGAE